MTVHFLDRRAFVNWRLVERAGKSKPDKVPCDPAGNVIDAQDPANWRTFPEASASQFPVGVVLSDGDPYFCIDLDGVRDPETGQLTAIATKILQMFPRAAVEISQSGEGLHIIGRCDASKLIGRRNRWSVDGQRVEFYDRARFIAFGSTGFEGDPETDCTAALLAFVPERTVESSDAPLTAGRDPAWSGPEDDDELLDRIRKWRSGPRGALGEKAPFDALWNADAAVLGQFFPAENAPFDASSADLALMSTLAFATGRDALRMERLFSRSALATRDKWKRGDYRNRTIRKACAGVVTVYSEKHPNEARRAAQLAEAKRIGLDDIEPPLPVVMTLDDMLRDLVAVEGSSAVVHRTTKRVRDSFDKARFAYAASRYTFTDEKGKVKEVPAIDVWKKNPARLSVDAITWAPGQPEFCGPPEGSDAGDRAFNLWKGLPAFTAPDDWQTRAQPFHDHLAYLVPDDGERTRFAQWLAHIVQRPGELPHTCYLMVTPTRGIGRNWLTGVLARVMRGYVAAGVTLGDVLDGGFNGRLSRKLLATVDETREGLTAKRYERANALQRIVTEETRLINPKYGLQRVEFNACRWLMLSNFEDALPFDNADRRVIVIANPIERQTESYYGRLYALLDDGQFIASVRQMLQTLDLTGFNPGGHAPMNAAKKTALASLESDLDRVVREFAETWPGQVCAVDDLVRYVRDATGEANVSAAHVGHAMRRAGMESANRVIRVAGGRGRVLIVREWTPERVKSASPGDLAAMITRARAQFADD